MTSRTRDRGNETHRQQVPIAVRQAQIKRDRRLRIVICTVVLVAASAVLAVMMLTSRPTSSALAAQSRTTSGDMPGMDHGTGDMPGMDHGTGDMPGMDHGSGVAPGSSPSPTSPSDMPGMDHGTGDTEETDPDRPLAPVLGTFGGGTSAVLLTAGFLRRKDRARSQAKEAARAARRTRS